MTPPFLPRALVAASASPADYESIAGDLHEEYTHRVCCEGRARADAWYWSQALRSIPPLLSYSRASASRSMKLPTCATTAGVLFLMLLCKDAVDAAIRHVDPGAAHWPFFLADWLDATFFGFVLAALLRSQGSRLALVAALFLAAAFAAPILLGISPPLPRIAWLLLLGAIPWMGLGAGLFQIVRRR